MFYNTGSIIVALDGLQCITSEANLHTAVHDMRVEEGKQASGGEERGSEEKP